MHKLILVVGFIVFPLLSLAADNDSLAASALAANPTAIPPPQTDGAKVADSLTSADNQQKPAGDQAQGQQQASSQANFQQNGQTDSQNVAPTAPQPKQPSLSQRAFANVVEKQLPMTPEQIISLHNAFEETQKVAANPPDVPARPATSSILVNLSPNSAPPVIRLGAGYISSLVFVDSTGQPWPIQAYSVGDPNAFNIQWDQKGNTLLVQADTFYKRSNLAVMLKDLNTPVMLTLLPGQTAIDYRVDLRIPGAGPNATYFQADLPNAADPILLDVLNGVSLRGAKALRVIGGDNYSQAWLLNNKLYLRTSLTVISPAWKAIMSSIDGMHAYELQPSSVILALQKGKEHVMKIVLEGLQ